MRRQILVFLSGKQYTVDVELVKPGEAIINGFTDDETGKDVFECSLSIKDQGDLLTAVEEWAKDVTAVDVNPYSESMLNRVRRGE